MSSFITFLNSAGKTFISFAVPMLIQSSILIILLLGLDVIIRNKVRAVVRYWIWMLILAKLVLPTSFSSPTGVAYWFGDRLPSIVAELPTSAEESVAPPHNFQYVDEVTFLESIRSVWPTEGGELKSAASLPGEQEVKANVAAEAPSLSWQALVFMTWVASVTIMSVLLIGRMVFVRRLFAQSKNPDSTLVDLFERCRRQMGVYIHVNLKLSPIAASPSVCGFFRPGILIPEEMSNRLGSQHLKSILLHELAHIKRGDLWVSFIQTVLQIVHIYNPLLWVANEIIRRVREQAVDETVLVAMGEEAEDYPATLLITSKLAFGRPGATLPLISVVESKSALKRRIKRMLNRPIPKDYKLGIAGVLAILIIGLLLLPMAKAEKKRELNREIASLNVQVEQLIARLNDAEREKALLHEKVSNLTSTTKGFHETTDKQGQLLKNTLNALDILQAEKIKQVNELKAITANLIEKMAIIADLEKENKRLLEEKADLQVKVAELLRQ